MIDIFKLFFNKIHFFVQQSLLFKFVYQFTLQLKDLGTTGIKPLDSGEDRVRQGFSSFFIFKIP